MKDNSTPKIFRLCDVTGLIKSSLLELSNQKFWVQAHIHVNRAGVKAGHFYCDLVDIDERGNQTAKIKGTIWSSRYSGITKKLKDAGFPNALQDNSEVCVLGMVRFHDVYGLSLDIIDVDPTFGEAQINRNRRIIIEKLTSEGILKKNSAATLPMAALKIGLISSKDSAAYKDFMQTLWSSGFSFKVVFSEASMQGEKTESEVISSIGFLEKACVDIICIIRGGGSQSDLAWFDNEKIARRITSSPIPVWVGIGHEIDVGVLDVVAHTSHKTPTAVAEALVGRLRDLVIGLEVAFDRLKNNSARVIALIESKQQRNIMGSVSGLKKYFALLEGNLRNSILRAESRFVNKFMEKEGSLDTRSVRMKEKLSALMGNRERDIADYTANLKSVTESAIISKLRAIQDAIDNLIPSLERNLKTCEDDQQRNIHGAMSGLQKYYHVVCERLEKNVARTDARFIKRFTDQVNDLAQKEKAIQTGFIQIIKNSGRALQERSAFLSASCLRRRLAAQNDVAGSTDRLRVLYQKHLQSKEQLFSTRVSRLQLSRYMKIVSDCEKSVAANVRRLNSLKPENVLRKGYSITCDAFGNVVRSALQLEHGQVIVTQYAEGSTESIISKKGEEAYDERH